MPKGPWFNPDNRDFVAESEAEDQELYDRGFSFYWDTFPGCGSVSAGHAAKLQGMTLARNPCHNYPLMLSLARALAERDLVLGRWTNVRVSEADKTWYLAFTNAADAITAKLVMPEIFDD